jgi:hypothetical protein
MSLATGCLVAILFSDTDTTLSIRPNIAHASYNALALSTLRSVGICKITVLASFQSLLSASFVRRGVSALPPIAAPHPSLSLHLANERQKAQSTSQDTTDMGGLDGP